METYSYYADGKWLEPASGEYFDSENPYTGEVFGPILAVMRFENDDEALQKANDSNFGLAAGIWTEDHRRALDLANRLEAGTVYINNYFDACTQSPVGGYKQSGYGRENGWEGMRGYLQTKSVWLSTARDIQAPF